MSTNVTTKTAPKCTAARHQWDWRQGRPESHGRTISTWEPCAHCGAKRQQETDVATRRLVATRYLAAR